MVTNGTIQYQGQIGDPEEDGLSPMAVSFIITGALFGLSVILGVIYALLYHTRISMLTRRKSTDRRQTLGETRMFRDGSRDRSSQRKTQTHFGMMNKYKK